MEMFEGGTGLTYEEESQIEQPANIYSIIRTLDFVEWAYNFSHIDQDTYVQHTNTILDQYRTATEAYQDKFHGIDDFCNKYDLTDCKYGINRIKNGNVQINSSANSSLGNVIQLTQRFNDLANFFYMREGQQNPIIVSEIYTFFNDLINIITQCKNIIPLEKPEIKKLLDWHGFIRSKRAVEPISYEDEKQISLDIQVAFDAVNIILNKK